MKTDIVETFPYEIDTIQTPWGGGCMRLQMDLIHLSPQPWHAVFRGLDWTCKGRDTRCDKSLTRRRDRLLQQIASCDM